MGNFEQAMEKTFAHEGWGKLINVKYDPGGETKWGISKRSYPEEDIARLDRNRAVELYRRDFWHPMYSDIASPEVAEELFDFGVNTSARGWPKLAVKILQESLGYLVVGPIVPDGVFGSQTLEAVNSASETLLMREFRARQAYYYADIVIRQPDASEADKKRFLLGWLRRVMA